MSKNITEVKETVYRKMTSLDGSNTIRQNHTEMLIRCSAGDKQAKLYVLGLIRKYLIEELVDENGVMSVDEEELMNLTQNIYAFNWGLGHLEKYDIDEIDEIMVHGTKILVQNKGKIIEVPEKFKNYEEAIAVVRRCLEFDKSQDINAKNCVVTTKRIDGSRITAVIPRVGKMPYLNIRKFDSFVPTTDNMLKSKTLTEEMAEALEILVKGKANIIVIGEMGSGKTTLLGWLLGFIPEDEIVGLMETTFEIHPEKLYPNRHWVQLEEQSDYDFRKLFPTILRMNVGRILVGESRSYEVNELIKAMTRGHRGSIGTAHSLGALEVVEDFADMVLESGKSMDIVALKHRIARAINIVILQRKLPNGRRVCSGIYELIPDNQTMTNYKTYPIFEFEVDEENPRDGGSHIKKNNISQDLRMKLNIGGIKMSTIERVFGEGGI